MKGFFLEKNELKKLDSVKNFIHLKSGRTSKSDESSGFFYSSENSRSCFLKKS